MQYEDTYYSVHQVVSDDKYIIHWQESHKSCIKGRLVEQVSKIKLLEKQKLTFSLWSSAILCTEHFFTAPLLKSFHVGAEKIWTFECIMGILPTSTA